MKRISSFVGCAIAAAISLTACAPPSDDSSAIESASSNQSGVYVNENGVEVKRVEGFGGVIAQSYEDSEEWWPEVETAPEGAPNVLILLLDDVGFAQIGSFGGVIETPNIDRLAEGGLRFNNFHTGALCSPSRASLMAGRNTHSIGLGSHALTAMGFPGYNAVMPESAKSVANYLGEEGYINYAIGKWDHTPLYEVSQVGPFDRWPSGEGFHHAYTFMAADVHQFVPVMWNDHSPEPYRESVHLDHDLADRAIEWITGHKSLKAEEPFMMLWASGSMHSPHHAPDEYLDLYAGQFDVGWDVIRERIHARQLEMGVIPPGTQLTERADQLPAWDSLSDDERRLFARQMEVFAAQLQYVDEQIGRIIEALERVGELDNTLIFVTADNGASGEGGLQGTFNETYVLNGLQTELDANLRHLEDWGRANTYPHYHAAWASAGNTPFQYFKQAVHRGGQSDFLVVHWPNGIEAQGEIRDQYHHIIDIAPTILDAASIEVPAEYHGIEQQPMDGISMRYAFTDADAPSQRTRQYYEMFGNRGIYADGWKAVSLHGQRMPWNTNSVSPFEDDVWELYNLEEDFSEANNLADQYPEKLEEMIAIFEEEAWKYNVYPLYDDMIQRLAKQSDRLFGDQTEFVYYWPGATRIAEKSSAPVKDRSHTIETTLNLTGGEEGTIVAVGGMTGGFTMFVQDGKVYYDYNYLDGVHYVLESPELPNGEVHVLFDFVRSGPFAGTGTLYINGEMVDQTDMPNMHISTYSLAETFDIGIDNGTAVSKMYNPPYEYTGTLDRVTINLTD